MATFYIDYEGGNDANDGTTFANRWKTITNGATAARIAPGDTIRVMASPEPTSIGSATWTGGGRPLAVNIASSTNATPIQITTSAAHDLSAGDYVAVRSHTTNTNANGVWKVGTVGSSTTFTITEIDGTNTSGNGTGGATGTITKVNNCIVKTASPLVKNIALCGGLGDKPAWTASTSVTTTQNSSYFREGYSSADISISATFTTGKAAYYTLPATLDLSAYQQVTFWVLLRTGTIGSAGDAYLALCTDTTGDTVAHICNIPALGATQYWVPVTVNFGTNLNNAIRSVAFYVVTDRGAQTFQLDNIVACKAASSADSITHQSLISKNTGDEAWYAIQSINHDVIMLANMNDISTVPVGSEIRGYNGNTETVTTYKRETIKTVPVGGSSSAHLVNKAGTEGSLITFSGGWNRTDMSTQTGETWFDGQNGQGYGLNSQYSYISVDKINFCRYSTAFYLQTTANYCQVGTMKATNCSSFAIYPAGNFHTFTDVWSNNSQTGFLINGYGTTVTSVKSSENCSNNGVTLASASGASFGSIVTGNCLTSNLILTSNAVIGNLVSSNGTRAINFSGSGGIRNYINGGSSSGSQATSAISMSANTELFLNNFTINEAVEISGLTIGTSYVYSNRHDNTDNNSWIWQAQGTINQQSSVVDSPATTSWKMNPTSVNATARTPVLLKLGTVVCAANSLVTVTARMRRDNTGLTMRLVCPGGQILGVSSDVFSDMTAAADTWETVAITFTPTKAGGVGIYAHAFGGTTYSGYVCNLTASQA